MEYQRYSGKLNEMSAGSGRTTVLSGLPLHGLAWFLAQVIADRAETIFVVVPTPLMAEDLAGDLGFFWPSGRARINLFPAFEAKPFMPQSTSPEAASRRAWALRQLASGEGPQVVIASAAATLRLVPAPGEAALRFRRIVAGAEIDLEDLKTFLSQNGYAAVGQVESRGDFSARGDIVDIFPAGRRLPARVELFGDFVESIRSFNIQDQRSVDRLDELLVAPVSEFAYEPRGGGLAAAELEKLALANGWHGLLWEPLAERLRLAETFSGLESWTPLFASLVPLDSYMKANVFNLVYEPEECRQAGEAAWLNLANHFDRLALEERPHLPLTALYQAPEELEASLARSGGGRWRVRNLPLPDEDAAAAHIHIPVEPNTDLKATTGAARRGAGLLGPLAARIRGLLGRGLNVNLVTRTAEQSRRLAEMLAEYDLSAAAVLSGRVAAGRLVFTVGQLSGGFAAPFAGEAYISEDEIFGGRERRRRRASEDLKGLNFASLKDLSPGDFVVHNIHGIGQYLGLVTLSLSYGQKGDFLHLVYKGGDKLYVPVELFSAVGKYVGAHDRPPALDRLGGLTWGRLKEKVKENIRQMAEELLKLYAARKIAPGHAYGGRDNLFTEFEASFEYAETPDQRKAIDEMLADLAAPRPMDRLICGDVGYGKTEVAMRAAFKVVSEGRQAAVLVPTTILAEQHGRTFEERLAPWGLRISSLSRFKKPSEIKELLKKAAEGSLDVIIGTHRLLQKDVKFK
ncbi:MAG: DEAD/DEAH box helicase, partial [Candidatus Adiutrix sp.]|nr:DEAD/DEAH box helicase [Candidatus Adiutrix sp.]